MKHETEGLIGCAAVLIVLSLNLAWIAAVVWIAAKIINGVFA